MGRAIIHAVVHAKAVELGRKSSVPDTAERLANATPSRHIASLVDRVREDAAKDLSDDEVASFLAQHLWIDWMRAELQHAEESVSKD